ncbi:MAG: cytochrome c oxidase subunit II [Acidobacteriota bacterium]|nr:cytochrome c oxidase subunit II [Acidobacteriota bacterium]MDE3031604.1 cytochrome c oxidase subunit II [Acidobacteriota bacterium]MDE3093407.1 cytochrome c oxidase subunit II [Acidobacteriota bacterium]MDE3139237.1 cytochrome c oxidase subunit II [Acidobacteriota bacterium]MDE3146164.1 cytochrome c oxidase subunit II [Acidobacteriota bacterium]
MAALVLSGCTVPGFGASAGVTESSKSAFHLWQGFSIGAVIIGALVVVLMLWAIVRYRRKGDRIPEQHQYHLPLEVIYTVVPILIVFGLFAATLVVENKATANPKTNVVVNVNAFQWGWQFLYPGTNALVYGQTTQSPIMEIPVNTNVHINLTSTDVIHGFYVRAFNFSRYALPGVVNQFTIRAQSTGTFFGQCTQLCGLYHSLMFFRVKVVTPTQYAQWLSTFNNPADIAKAAAALATTNAELASGVASKTSYTKFGR